MFAWARIINCLMKIERNMELESIRREFPIKACADGEELMAIGDLAINRFGPQCKKLVMQRANLSPAGLSNFLKGLKEN